jgi:hypothetical protein
VLIAAVVVLMAVAAFVLHTRHTVSVGGPTPVLANAGTLPAKPSANVQAANLQAADARRILDKVTHTIMNDRGRALTAEEAQTLRTALADECAAAEDECDQAIRSDPRNALA